MDFSQFNTRVLKEPRGMIRIIQVAFAIFAFSTTASFDTESTLTVSCVDPKSPAPLQRLTKYPIEYPFDFRKTNLNYLSGCDGGADSFSSKTLDMDFSTTPRFFVATGVVSMLYSSGSLAFYIYYAPLYESNPVFPILDFALTSIWSLFWFAGSTAWATNVSDVKHYTSPHYLMNYIPYCDKKHQSEITTDCLAESPGKWSTLYITLIFGFANIFLWAASMWFVYKETTFHKRTLRPQTVRTGQTRSPRLSQAQLEAYGQAPMQHIMPSNN